MLTIVAVPLIPVPETVIPTSSAIVSATVTVVTPPVLTLVEASARLRLSACV